jgi:nucleoside-diphosphate-sugar epimerase
MQDDSNADDSIRDLADLEDRLSAPTDEVIETLAHVDGDILVLGVAGKMGPSLARMARRASDAAGVRRRVIGVARFTDPAVERTLRDCGVETIPCDLLDPAQIDRLPDAPHVVFMAGMKFGSTGKEALTWAINAYLPGMVCRKFRGSRIVAFSSGNVYGPTPVDSGGSRETDPVNPRGEYAMSCVGRERIFEHFSRALGTQVVLIRLNYATEMRYGVLVDLAQKVMDGEPLDLEIGFFNTIWQGDANVMALRAFDLAASPSVILNVSGEQILSVRGVAQQFGALFGKPVTFRGTESSKALLSDTGVAQALFGPSRTGVDQLIRWTAEWLRHGRPTLGKPTKFEVSDGRF